MQLYNLAPDFQFTQQTKADVFFRLSTDAPGHSKTWLACDIDTAYSEYANELAALQQTEEHYQINLTAVLKASTPFKDGHLGNIAKEESLGWEQYFSLAGHDENGALPEHLFAYDTEALRSHFAQGLHLNPSVLPPIMEGIRFVSPGEKI